MSLPPLRPQPRAPRERKRAQSERRLRCARRPGRGTKAGLVPGLLQREGSGTSPPQDAFQSCRRLFLRNKRRGKCRVEQERGRLRPGCCWPHGMVAVAPSGLRSCEYPRITAESLGSSAPGSEQDLHQLRQRPVCVPLLHGAENSSSREKPRMPPAPTAAGGERDGVPGHDGQGSPAMPRGAEPHFGSAVVLGCLPARAPRGSGGLWAVGQWLVPQHFSLSRQMP